MSIFAPPITATTQTNSVATSQTTTSATFTDLSTVGPTVTINIGSSGLALVIVSANIQNNTAGTGASMSWAASGVNTIAAADTQSLVFVNSNLTLSANALIGSSKMFLATGLTPGSTTFTAKYRAPGGNTATFDTRQIIVIPL